MNVFQCIYCNQYAALKATGRVAHKARKNGIIINTAALVLNLFTCMALVSTFYGNSKTGSDLDSLYAIFGSGRGAGVLFGFDAFVILGVITYVFFGSDDYYQRTIVKFEQLEPKLQKRVTRTGAAYLFGSVGIFLLAEVWMWVF